MSEDKSETLGRCKIRPNLDHRKDDHLTGDCIDWRPLPSSEGTVKSPKCHKCKGSGDADNAQFSCSECHGSGICEHTEMRAFGRQGFCPCGTLVKNLPSPSVPLKSETVPLGYSGIIDGINDLDGHIRYMEKAPDVLIGRVKSKTVPTEADTEIETRLTMSDDRNFEDWSMNEFDPVPPNNNDPLTLATQRIKELESEVRELRAYLGAVKDEATQGLEEAAKPEYRR